MISIRRIVACWLLSSWLACWATSDSACGQSASGPSAKEATKLVTDYFSSLADYRPGDLISRTQVSGLLDAFAERDWQLPNQKKLLSDTLEDGNFLVQLSRSRSGRPFLRKVAGYQLIYDRLDRIARQSGGQALLRDLVKLPDGARYAKKKPGRGVPNLLDLLPKSRNGKTRKISDYDKATGRIYTAAGLTRRIQSDLAAARK